MTVTHDVTLTPEQLADAIDYHTSTGNLVIFQPGWPVTVAPLHVAAEILRQRLILETASIEGRKPS